MYLTMWRNLLYKTTPASCKVRLQLAPTITSTTTSTTTDSKMRTTVFFSLMVCLLQVTLGEQGIYIFETNSHYLKIIFTRYFQLMQAHQQVALKIHNQHRSDHRTPGLSLDEQVNSCFSKVT